MSRWRVQPMGDNAEGVKIDGDPRRPEPAHFRVSFPFGEVEIVRATDGEGADYWVHVYVNNPRNANYCPDEDAGQFSAAGVIKDARLDQADKAARDADVGDFARPELYHLAVRIGRPVAVAAPAKAKRARRA